MKRRDYYQILHVQPDAPVEVIRASYRTLMQKLKMHPDLGGAHDHAVLINEAFAVLSRPEKRAAYDARNESPGWQQTQAVVPPSLPAEAKWAGTHSECPFCRAPRMVPIPDFQDVLCDRCQSPLFPVAGHEESADSRRTVERLPRRMVVTCTDARRPGVNLKMMTEDVSIHGMCVKSPHELSPGQILRIEHSFGKAVGFVTRVAVVRSGWSKQWRAGVQFLTMQLAERRGVFLSLRG